MRRLSRHRQYRRAVAMRLYALILALAVCSARAVPIELEKSEDVTPVEKEPTDDANIDNLRNVPEVIPVAIVEDDVRIQKPDENSNDYVPSDDEPSINIKRIEIDLDNPGPPQRQQHETQNPEVYADRDYFIADIKQKLLDTENIFKKSVSNINQGFAKWVPNTEHLKSVQNDIKEMQNKFLTQLTNLNRSLKNYLNPQSTKSIIADPESTANLKEVEIRLKALENNFKAGVETLSEGVKILEAKADGETGSPDPAPPSSSNEQSTNNPFGQVFQFFSNAVGQAINQVQNTFNSFTNPPNSNNDNASSSDPNAPPAAQADDAAAARPPSLWENIQTQLSQIFNSGQQASTGDSTLPNPFNQANQFFQNVLNSFRPPGSDSKPENDPPAPSKPDKPVQPVATQVQAEPVQPAAAEQPIKKQEAVPAKVPPAAPQPGPIQQIVQNNPIVKGIVQRLQSITNPEKPRVKPQQASKPVQSEKPVKGESIKKDPVPITKGHGGYNGGNGGQNGGGDNNDSDRLEVQDVLLEEKVEEVPHKCEMNKESEVLSDKEEKENLLLPEKTE